MPHARRLLAICLAAALAAPAAAHAAGEGLAPALAEMPASTQRLAPVVARFRSDLASLERVRDITAGPRREAALRGLGLQQLLIRPRTRQLINRQIECMADHLQAQTAQVLQLLHHRTGGAIGAGQGIFVQIAGVTDLFLGLDDLGDQHGRLDRLGQPAH